MKCFWPLFLLCTALACQPKGRSLPPVDKPDPVEAVSPLPDTVFRATEIPDSVFNRMLGKSYPRSGAHVPREELRYLQLSYWDYAGQSRIGELVCHRSIAAELLSIFRALYAEAYPIASLRLVDDFGADDEASMAANNSSCFNDRRVASSGQLSRHALGMAVDINPLENPQVFAHRSAPAAGAAYADRSRDFPHKIDLQDRCYQIFRAHGFSWGGQWPRNKDYQHFVHY